MSQISIQLGDSLELLKKYPDNHFDSIVTDAPYGFGKEPDPVAMLQAWITSGYMEIKGTGFMGKKWDAFVPQPIFWKEVFRVLKPGGYLLCFFGTRTYDWGTMAIRLAGFEIRDMITWHYGSGFPKSLDVSKAIDKSAGVEREKKQIKFSSKVLMTTEGNTRPWQDEAEKKGYHELAGDIPVSDDAIKYDGWGTALKPATEPICVARKPLIGTVAQNMILHGTGGINIDGCRVDFENEADLRSATYGTGTNIIGANYVGSKLTDGRKNIEANSNGRFPANVIMDPFMGDIMDEQTGILTSGKAKPTTGKYTSNIYADSGGASRFFYCAKASQDERNAGCEHLSLKDPSSVTDFRPTLKSDPAAWAETESAYMRTTARNNNHPTVKPISVMRWVQRLVTPVGGLTLDPFAGSGTSGCSAAFEGFDIVLMEAEAEYLPIIKARTEHWQKVANREKYIEELKNSQTTLF